MSFQAEISQLQNTLTILNQQANATSEKWSDTVQERFYEQFINSLPKEFQAYIIELDKLDKTFESAEQSISNLMY